MSEENQLLPLLQSVTEILETGDCLPGVRWRSGCGVTELVTCFDLSEIDGQRHRNARTVNNDLCACPSILQRQGLVEGERNRTVRIMVSPPW